MCAPASQRKTPSIGRKSNLDTVASTVCAAHPHASTVQRGRSPFIYRNDAPNVPRLIWLLNHSAASQTHPIIIIIIISSRAFLPLPPSVRINQIKLYDFNSFINSIINAAEYVTHFMGFTVSQLRARALQCMCEQNKSIFNLFVNMIALAGSS